MKRLFLLLLILAAGRAEGAKPHPLAWDALEKKSEPKPGEDTAWFTFRVTNRSDRAVTITQVQPSCGCTTVETPPVPWVLAAGAKGEVNALVDFRGKEGAV